MFKLVDIAGFRTTSTTHCAIQKYLNTSSGNYEYVINFENDFDRDDVFYITQDISYFFNTLKGNGSEIVEENNRYVLIGSKLYYDGRIYTLNTYRENPLNMPEIESISLEVSNNTFREIMEDRMGDDLNDLDLGM